MKTHVIRWTSSVSGTMGTGTKRFDKEQAERLAQELNEGYPEIVHEAVILAPPRPEPPNAAPASLSGAS